MQEWFAVREERRGEWAVLQCKDCGKNVGGVDMAAEHMLVEHCDARYDCPKCGAWSTDRIGMRIHIKFAHGEPDIDVTPGCTWCEKRIAHLEFCMVERRKRARKAA